MDYINTNYVIFNISEVDKIDFSLVFEDNSKTLRKSFLLNNTFVNWYGTNTPAFVANLNTKQGVYTYLEVLEILKGAEWNLA
jgi:hypothetical protein